MSKFASKKAREFYAQTYDSVVPDWPGEIDFYRELATEARTTRPFWRWPAARGGWPSVLRQRGRGRRS